MSNRTRAEFEAETGATGGMDVRVRDGNPVLTIYKLRTGDGVALVTWGAGGLLDHVMLMNQRDIMAMADWLR